MARNILIAAVRNFDNRSSGDYFCTDTPDGVRFIDGVVTGEAGSKLILSQYSIDEIILVGSDLQISVEMPVGLRTPLKEGIDLLHSDVGTLSDFDYFRYRLMQFVENVDMETLDIYETVPAKRRKEIQKAAEEVFGCDKSGYLAAVYASPALWRQLLAKVGNLSLVELNWLKRFIYAESRKEDKVTSCNSTGDIPVSFVPVSIGDSSSGSMMNSIHTLMRALYLNGSDDINLYLDVQGFEPADNYIFLSLFTMLSKTTKRIVIKDIVSSTDIPRSFIYRVSNSRKRINVERLLSGIGSLINDGRVDQLRSYWYESGISNDYIDRMMYTLGKIETGLLLCSMEQLENGILELHELVNSENMISGRTGSEEEAFIFALRDAIVSDYAGIVNVREKEIEPIELVKWLLRKGFVQQAVTVIESKIPHDMIRKGLFYPAADAAEKEKYIRAINALYWDADKKEKWKFKDFEHFFIKDYGGTYIYNSCPRGMKMPDFRNSVRASQVYSDAPTAGLLKAHSLLPDEQYFIKIYGSYFDVCALRNAVNHGNVEGADASETDLRGDSPVMTYVRDQLYAFADCYEEALRATAGKAFRSAVITDAELAAYFPQHGPRDDPDCFKAEGYISGSKRPPRGPKSDAADKNGTGSRSSAAPAGNFDDVDVCIARDGRDVCVKLHWK